MSSKPWENPKPGRRNSRSLEIRRVLIVCEDEKSSCYYFKSFKVDENRVEIRPLGVGRNTDSLVNHAVKLKSNASKAGQPFNEIWCVFDRDSFPIENYNQAFQLASANGIKVAWANEAFELWYLLHFNYHDTGINRGDYKEKLKPQFAYEKSDKNIYDKVIARQETAIRNAKKLESHWNALGKQSPQWENPSTSVHKLVERLNELAKLGPTE